MEFDVVHRRAASWAKCCCRLMQKAQEKRWRLLSCVCRKVLKLVPTFSCSGAVIESRAMDELFSD